MTEPEQPLTPADFSPQSPASNTADSQAPRPGWQGPRPGWIVPGLAALVLLAIAVFFVLPALIASPTPTDSGATTPLTNQREANGAPLNASGTGEQLVTDRSPFAEAQANKQRRAAQEALQKALELQDILTELAVTEWATEAYEAALATAALGDNAYRERRFDDATLAYLEAAEQLLAIESTLPERINTTTTELTGAIEAGELDGALAALDLLQKLAPNDPSLDNLGARVAAIKPVTAALVAAADYAAQANYELALDNAQQALSADPASQRASTAYAEYQTSLQEQRYRQAMTNGYLALERSQFDTAEAAFKRAASLKAGSTEPQTALAELAGARIDTRLRSLRQLGEEHEQAEDWQAAESAYQEALAVDGSLVFAQQGLARVQPRKELNERLIKILEEPERLVDSRALASAQSALTQAQAVTNPGPVLSAQIAKLEKTLRYATVPLPVVLLSDGLTDVTLLRVKRLGSFTNKPLSLRPGRYTALGIRNGYRDVRINFEVKPGELPPIDVRCTESIEGSL